MYVCYEYNLTILEFCWENAINAFVAILSLLFCVTVNGECLFVIKGRFGIFTMNGIQRALEYQECAIRLVKLPLINSGEDLLPIHNER